MDPMQPGGNESLLQEPALLSPPKPPPIPAPKTLGPTGPSTAHSGKAAPLNPDIFFGCNAASCGEKLLSRDGKRANPSLPVHRQPCAAGAVHLGRSCDSPCIMHQHLQKSAL